MKWPRALPSVRTLVTAAAIGGGLIVLGGAGWLWHAAQQRQAQSAHADALAQTSRARVPEASAEAKASASLALEGALTAYPDAATAPQTAYALGNLRFDLRQYGPARGAYEVALAKGPPPTVRILARAGIGYAWEAEGDYPQAIGAFQAALSGVKPRDFLYETLTLDLARAQELGGRKAEAVETYRRLLREAPGTHRATDVRTRLASLGGAP